LQAERFIGVLFKEKPGDEKIGQFLRETLKLNLAACHVKLRQFGEAMPLLEQIITAHAATVGALAKQEEEEDGANSTAINNPAAMKKNYIKALYRRATCYMGQGLYDSATKDINAILKVDQDNADAKILMLQIEQVLKESKVKEKKAFANMFNEELYTDKPNVILQKQLEDNKNKWQWIYYGSSILLVIIAIIAFYFIRK